MEFDSNKPIYLQIGDSVCNKILRKELLPEDRILSVREMGAQIGVNPNTVARSYEKLMDAGIIYNKRGMGFYVAQDAREIVLSRERKAFLETELPAFLKRMELLGLSAEELLKQ